ncbi:endonuclease domain-containing 1 -like [Paramuricea clavata]|uniref:Endonuclease domain-containing 1 -like n=1 Tax=Paramuricea clavata TaxID=317549 RepID=A0A7D9IX89_PARCT|nr:endonuclease domain-containing 1 -like [Paramuricea clavata]
MTSGINYFMLWVNLYLIHFSTIQAQCTGNGFMNSCACNFINACKYDASTNTFDAFSGSARHLERFIPNVRSYAMPTSQVTQICEPGNFGIIYDCENRIPLAATAILTADQYESTAKPRPGNKFKPSALILHNFQQNDNDYRMPLQRIPCYETSGNRYYFEKRWYEAITKKTIAPFSACPVSGKPVKSPIHRGHLIAAQYGRGSSERPIQTFVFTNAVPQFATLNSGRWNKFENTLIEWARSNCRRAPLHVIVGSIPSTYPGNERRFICQPGFSNFMGGSFKFGGEYRANVPAFLWTAVCCHSVALSTSFTRSTTFFAPNIPIKPGLVNSIEVSRLFSAVRAHHIDLFPGMPSCNDDANYIPIFY